MRRSLSLLLLLLAGCVSGYTQSELHDAPRGWRVQPGDEITVEVEGLPDMQWTGTPDTEGNIALAFIEKPVPAVCHTAESLAQEIAKGYARFLRKPQVNVKIMTGEQVKPPVLVFGGVRQPARYLLHRPTRLVELLAASGGASGVAGQRVRVVPTVEPVLCGGDGTWQRRNLHTFEPYLFDLDAVLRGEGEHNPEIFPGDVITVLTEDWVYVGGNVSQPAAVPLGAGLTLTDALEKVGGALAGSGAVIVWREAPGARKEFTFGLKSLKKGPADFALQSNDVIIVPSIGMFRNTGFPHNLARVFISDKEILRAMQELPLKVLE